MTLNNFFDKIYCINLDRRQDRWEQCIKIFEKHNLEVERIPAFDWMDIDWISSEIEPRYKANIANLISVINVLKKPVNRGLLLEDDVDFIENLNFNFSNYVKHLPEDWGFLYLGGNHEGGFQNLINKDQSISPIIKCNRTYALHAFGYTREAAKYTVDLLNQAFNHIKNNPNVKIREVVCADYWIGQIQHIVPTYSFINHLAFQRSDFSDIEQVKSNYEWLKYNYKK